MVSFIFGGLFAVGVISACISKCTDVGPKTSSVMLRVALVFMFAALLIQLVHFVYLLSLQHPTPPIAVGFFFAKKA